MGGGGSSPWSARGRFSSHAMIKILFTGMTKTRSLGDLGTKIPKNLGLEVNYVIANMGGEGGPPPGGLADVFLRPAPLQNGRRIIFWGSRHLPNHWKSIGKTMFWSSCRAPFKMYEKPNGISTLLKPKTGKSLKIIGKALPREGFCTAFSRSG